MAGSDSLRLGLVFGDWEGDWRRGVLGLPGESGAALLPGLDPALLSISLWMLESFSLCSSGVSSTTFGFQSYLKLTMGRLGLSETNDGVGRLGLRSLRRLDVAARISSDRFSSSSGPETDFGGGGAFVVLREMVSEGKTETGGRVGLVG